MKFFLQLTQLSKEVAETQERDPRTEGGLSQSESAKAPDRWDPGVAVMHCVFMD
jgi:hypothetical protein